MKYTLFLLTFLLAISSYAQGVTNDFTRSRVTFHTATMKVMVEGKPAARMTDITTTHVDCSSSADQCTREIDESTEGESAAPDDSSGPGEESTEDSVTEGSSQVESESSGDKKFPSAIIIDSWTEGESAKTNRWCVWVKLDGKWILSKRPRRTIRDLKKYILNASAKK